MTDIIETISSCFSQKISFVPIIPGEKRPGEFLQGRWRGMEKWNEYSMRHPSREEVFMWESWPLASIGILTGKLSQIIALDFDYREDIAKEIEKVVPVSPLRKKGAKGYTAFYKYNGEENTKWSVNGEVVLELLSDGRQTLIPPSIHPTGLQYEWITEYSFQNFDKENLTILKDHHYESIRKIIDSYQPKQKIEPSNTSLETSSGKIDDIKYALTFIPADDYHLWIKIGMALRSWGHSAGFIFWNEWSQKSSKYNPSEIGKKWNSFGETNITIASLFYEAQQYGYKWVSKKNVEIIESKNEIVKQENFSIPKNIIENAPGLVGRIASWINNTSIYKHPILSLGASLAAVGALKAHRVRTETNLRTNLLILGLAPASSGKGRAMEQVENLLVASGLEKLLGGKPVSDSAVIKMLKNGKGRRLIQWDEIGIALQEMTNARAAGHKAAILGIMMELFSSAGKTYRGKEYADHDNKMKRMDLIQPCLCVYGATTPGRLYDSLSSSHTVDGFAPRWLVMETDVPFPTRREIGINDVPTDLIRDVQLIEKMTTNDTPQGNIDEVFTVRPKVIFCETRAKKLLIEIQDFFDLERRKNSEEHEGIEAIWGRGVEHILKISLTIEEGPEISYESVLWSFDLVKHCIKNLVTAVIDRISDNEHQRSLNRILTIVRKRGPAGISRSSLYNQTRWLKTYERNDIIETLVESNLILIVDSSTSTKTAQTFIAKEFFL